MSDRIQFAKEWYSKGGKALIDSQNENNNQKFKIFEAYIYL